VLTVAFLGSNPAEYILVDRVDLIELNHYYDEHGRHVFDQTIYYDWCPIQGRYNVRTWRLVKTPSQLPWRDAHSGRYTAIWHDGGVVRKVTADFMRETWTQYDPELVEQEYLPKDMRRDLSKPMATVLSHPQFAAQAEPLRPAQSPRYSYRQADATAR
jgi:hypothetical protein